MNIYTSFSKIFFVLFLIFLGFNFLIWNLIVEDSYKGGDLSRMTYNPKYVTKKVIDEIYKQVDSLAGICGSSENVKVILRSLAKNCKIVYSKDKNLIIRICNMAAPEHLEIMMEDADDVLKDIKNAGAIFVGDYTPVAVGDYIGGTNHVIPTSGCARFSSSLGVYDFCKRSSIISYDREMLKDESKYVEILSSFENLIAHKNSIKARFKK